MGDKAFGSKPVNTRPRLHNRFVDATAFYEQQQRLGSGRPPKPLILDKNIIKCRNNVGTNLTRGSVIDVSDYLLTGNAIYDPVSLWFNGDEPAGGHYAVFRGAVEDGEIADAQLTGVCIARVNITDANHNFATPTSGQTYFTSATSGEIQILDKATAGTGVKECVVVLRCGSPGEMEFVGFGEAAENIVGGDYGDPTSASWTVPSFTAGTVNLFRLDAGDSDEFEVYSPDEEIEAYNISNFDINTPASVRVYRLYDRSSGGTVYACEPWWNASWGQQGRPKCTFSGTASVGTSSATLTMTADTDNLGLIETDGSSPTRIQFNRPGRHRLSLRVSSNSNSVAGAITITLQDNGEFALSATSVTVPQFTTSGTYVFDYQFDLTVLGQFAVPKFWITAQRPSGSSTGDINVNGILEPTFD